MRIEPRLRNGREIVREGERKEGIAKTEKARSEGKAQSWERVGSRRTVEAEKGVKMSEGRSG